MGLTTPSVGALDHETVVDDVVVLDNAVEVDVHSAAVDSELSTGVSSATVLRGCVVAERGAGEGVPDVTSGGWLT